MHLPEIGDIPVLISLLALLCYGLGRLAVDGFYGQLPTTAEAVGLGYASIIEPAAIVATFAAVIWIVVGAISDVISGPNQRVGNLTRVVVLIGLTVLAAILGQVDVGVAAVGDVIPFAAAFAAPPFRALGDRISEFRIRLGRGSRPAENSAPTREGGLKPVGNLIYAALVLLVLSVGAHELGIHEGRQATAGKAVALSYFGFRVPGMTTSVVRVHPLASSSAFAPLTKETCWLQLGVGPGGLVLYSPASRDTLTVPPDQVVVTAMNGSCPQTGPAPGPFPLSTSPATRKPPPSVPVSQSASAGPTGVPTSPAPSDTTAAPASRTSPPDL